MIALLVAVAVPLTFLYAVRRLDLYGQGGFGVVARCFLWGFVAFLGSYYVNSAALEWFGQLKVRTVVAPVVEEIWKALPLVYYVRRPQFTYFVDGAIYGFATGTAFAVVEALFYLLHASADGGLSLSVNRAFSTSLMHGTTSALVGVTLGRLRFGSRATRLMALVLGLGIAMGVHLTYNWLVVTHPFTNLLLAAAIALGVGGLTTIALLIRQGLAEERTWLRDTLGLGMGVTRGEAAVVDHLADVNQLLAPVAAHFGDEKRRQVEAFVRMQAQLGLKHKAAELSQDGKLRLALLEEARGLEAAVDDLRRQVGVYCMSYVRQIYPGPSEPVWLQLEAALGQAPAGDGPGVWAQLSDRISAEPELYGGGLDQ